MNVRIVFFCCFFISYIKATVNNLPVILSLQEIELFLNSITRIGYGEFQLTRRWWRTLSFIKQQFFD